MPMSALANMGPEDRGRRFINSPHGVSGVFYLPTLPTYLPYPHAFGVRVVVSYASLTHRYSTLAPSYRTA